jgi:hypothetical protein
VGGKHASGSPRRRATVRDLDLVSSATPTGSPVVDPDESPTRGCRRAPQHDGPRAALTTTIAAGVVVVATGSVAYTTALQPVVGTSTGGSRTVEVPAEQAAAPGDGQVVDRPVADLPASRDHGRASDDRDRGGKHRSREPLISSRVDSIPQVDDGLPFEFQNPLLPVELQVVLPTFPLDSESEVGFTTEVDLDELLPQVPASDSATDALDQPHAVPKPGRFTGMPLAPSDSGHHDSDHHDSDHHDSDHHDSGHHDSGHHDSGSGSHDGGSAHDDPPAPDPGPTPDEPEPDTPDDGHTTPDAPATPNEPSTPDDGGDTPDKPSTPDDGGETPDKPSTPDDGGDTPDKPSTPDDGNPPDVPAPDEHPSGDAPDDNAGDGGGGTDAGGGDQETGGDQDRPGDGDDGHPGGIDDGAGVPPSIPDDKPSDEDGQDFPAPPQDLSDDHDRPGAPDSGRDWSGEQWFDEPGDQQPAGSDDEQTGEPEWSSASWFDSDVSDRAWSSDQWFDATESGSTEPDAPNPSDGPGGGWSSDSWFDAAQPDSRT